jgi:hypothetical protein
MDTRNIPPGVRWPDAIADAIERSKMLLVLLSASSNSSDNVAQEVSLAGGKLIPLMPVRVENCIPSRGLTFYLHNVHYLDVHPKSLTEYRNTIVRAVRDLLGVGSVAKPVAGTAEGSIPSFSNRTVSTSSASELTRILTNTGLRACRKQARKKRAAMARKAGSAPTDTPQSSVQAADEVVGIDLGHGETAVAKVSVNHDTSPTAITVRGKTSQITALGYHPDRGFVIGQEALLDPDVQAVLTTFKQRPTDDPSYPEILADYLRTYYQVLRDSGNIRGGEKSHFFIGCPSG